MSELEQIDSSKNFSICFFGYDIGYFMMISNAVIRYQLIHDKPKEMFL